MPAVLNDPEVVTFDRADFERAWQRDADASKRVTVVPPTAITINRNSPHDFQDRQIYLWIDDEPLGKIRYGAAITRSVAPGRHTVRAFNTLFTRTLSVDVAPGEETRVRCGTGMPTAGWLMMVLLHVTYLRVWLELGD